MSGLLRRDVRIPDWPSGPLTLSHRPRVVPRTLLDTERDAAESGLLAAAKLRDALMLRFLARQAGARGDPIAEQELSREAADATNMRSACNTSSTEFTQPRDGTTTKPPDAPVPAPSSQAVGSLPNSPSGQGRRRAERDHHRRMVRPCRPVAPCPPLPGRPVRQGPGRPTDAYLADGRAGTAWWWRAVGGAAGQWVDD
jgi:hypothetical protein